MLDNSAAANNWQHMPIQQQHQQEQQQQQQHLHQQQQHHQQPQLASKLFQQQQQLNQPQQQATGAITTTVNQTWQNTPQQLQQQHAAVAVSSPLQQQQQQHLHYNNYFTPAEQQQPQLQAQAQAQPQLQQQATSQQYYQQQQQPQQQLQQQQPQQQLQQQQQQQSQANNNNANNIYYQHTLQQQTTQQQQNQQQQQLQQATHATNAHESFENNNIITNDGWDDWEWNDSGNSNAESTAIAAAASASANAGEPHTQQSQQLLQPEQQNEAGGVLEESFNLNNSNNAANWSWGQLHAGSHHGSSQVAVATSQQQQQSQQQQHSQMPNYGTANLSNNYANHHVASNIPEINANANAIDNIVTAVPMSTQQAPLPSSKVITATATGVVAAGAAAAAAAATTATNASLAMLPPPLPPQQQVQNTYNLEIGLMNSTITPPAAFQNAAAAAAAASSPLSVAARAAPLPPAALGLPPLKEAQPAVVAGGNPFKRAGPSQYHRATGLLATNDTAAAAAAATVVAPPPLAPPAPLPVNVLAQPTVAPVSFAGSVNFAPQAAPVHGQVPAAAAAAGNSEILMHEHENEVAATAAVAAVPTHAPAPPNDERAQYLQTSHLSEQPDGEAQLEADNLLPPPGLSRLVPLGQPELVETQLRLVTGTEQPNSSPNAIGHANALHMEERHADGEDTSDEQSTTVISSISSTSSSNSNNLPLTGDRNLYLVAGESNGNEQRVVTGVETAANVGLGLGVGVGVAMGTGVNVGLMPIAATTGAAATLISEHEREIVLDGENLEDQQQQTQRQLTSLATPATIIAGSTAANAGAVSVHSIATSMSPTSTVAAATQTPKLKAAHNAATSSTKLNLNETNDTKLNLTAAMAASSPLPAATPAKQEQQQHQQQQQQQHIYQHTLSNNSTGNDESESHQSRNQTHQQQPQHQLQQGQQGKSTAQSQRTRDRDRDRERERNRHSDRFESEESGEFLSLRDERERERAHKRLRAHDGESSGRRYSDADERNDDREQQQQQQHRWRHSGREADKNAYDYYSKGGSKSRRGQQSSRHYRHYADDDADDVARQGDSGGAGSGPDGRRSKASDSRRTNDDDDYDVHREHEQRERAYQRRRRGERYAPGPGLGLGPDGERDREPERRAEGRPRRGERYSSTYAGDYRRRPEPAPAAHYRDEVEYEEYRRRAREERETREAYLAANSSRAMEINSKMRRSYDTNVYPSRLYEKIIRNPQLYNDLCTKFYSELESMPSPRNDKALTHAHVAAHDISAGTGGVVTGDGHDSRQSAAAGMAVPAAPLSLTDGRDSRQSGRSSIANNEKERYTHAYITQANEYHRKHYKVMQQQQQHQQQQHLQQNHQQHQQQQHQQQQQLQMHTHASQYTAKQLLQQQQQLQYSLTTTDSLSLNSTMFEDSMSLYGDDGSTSRRTGHAAAGGHNIGGVLASARSASNLSASATFGGSVHDLVVHHHRHHHLHQHQHQHSQHRAYAYANSEYAESRSGLDAYAPATPRWPLKFTEPHAFVRFCVDKFMTIEPSGGSATGGRLGYPMNLYKLNEQSGSTTHYASYPGPLVANVTFTEKIIAYCEEQMHLGPTAASASASMYAKPTAKGVSLEMDMRKCRASHKLLWSLLIQMMRQKGRIDGTDVANLLSKNEEEFPYELAADGVGVHSTIVSSAAAAAANTAPATSSSASAVANNVLTPAQATDKFRKLLTVGNKSDALDWATEHQLWGHALYIASRMDSRAHASVLKQFALSNVANNDPLLTLYQVLSNHTPISVTSLHNEKWGDWRPHFAMIITNTAHNPELGCKAIAILGDSLFQRGDIYAAHFAYILANVNFAHHDVSALEESSFKPHLPKLVLLGSSHYRELSKFATDEAIIMTEVYEYARSLNEHNYSIVPLQYYKYLLAIRLLDAGYNAKCLLYLEQIALHIQRDPSQFTRTFIEKICNLADQLRYNDPLLQKPLDETRLSYNSALNYVEQAWLSNLRLIYEQHELSNNNNNTAAVVVSAGTNTAQIHQEFVELNKQFDALNMQYIDNNNAEPQHQQQQQQQQQPLPINEQQQQQQQQQVQYYEQQSHVGATDAAAAAYAQATQQQTYNAQYAAGGDVAYGQQQYEQQKGDGGYYDHTQSQQQQQLDAAGQDLGAYGAGAAGAAAGAYDYWAAQQQQPHDGDENAMRAAQPSISLPRSKTYESDEDDVTNHGDNHRKLTKTAAAAAAATATADGKQSQSQDGLHRKDSGKGTQLPGSHNNGGGHQNSSWLNGIWSKITLKPKNQMILPDDKNPSIIWDPDKQRWVNKDGDESEEHSLRPPPKMADLMAASGGMINAVDMQQQQQHQSQQQSVPQQQQQQPTQGYVQPTVAAPALAAAAATTTATSESNYYGNEQLAAGMPAVPQATGSDASAATPKLQSNAFKAQRYRKLKNSYVDVFNPSGAPLKNTAENVMAPVMPSMGVPQGGFLIPGAPMQPQQQQQQQQQKQDGFF